MGHERSRRLLHQNADDLRPEDSRSWRQPFSPEYHATRSHRDRTSTIAAVSNSIKFNVTRHRGRTVEHPLVKSRKPSFGARDGSLLIHERYAIKQSVCGSTCQWYNGGCRKSRREEKTLADHPNKHIREAVEYAENNGWRVVKANARAHIWGRIYCPLQNREGCAKAVYSTPRNPEDHAKDIRRAVDRCPHG